MAHFKANKHRGRCIRRIYSHKNNCLVKVESYLEALYCYKLELSEHVKVYTSQPETMRLGKEEYTPDFLVVYANGSAAYIEVHHSSRITEQYKRKIAKFSHYALQQSGRRIELITERYLPVKSAENMALIISQMCGPLPSKSFIDTELPDSITLEELITLLSGYFEQPIGIAYHLIGKGIYLTDLTQPLSANTLLVLSPQYQQEALC